MSNLAPRDETARPLGLCPASLAEPSEAEGWDVILEALRQREGRVDTPDFLAGWVEGWARVHGWKLVRA